MGAKYTSTSVSGYNAGAPADDGSTSESNKVKWATIKQKLPDPLKTALESMDTKLAAWAAYGPTSVAEATTIAAADNEKFIEVTSACTMTLTDASTLGAGWMAYIVNTSNANVTLARATGGDTLDGVAANGTLAAGKSIAIVVNTAADGFLSFAHSYPGTRLGTMQTSTSGTSIDFTSIPAGTKLISVMLEGVSTNGTSDIIIQLGDSGGVEDSSYGSRVWQGGSGDTLDVGNTTGWAVAVAVTAATSLTGVVVLTLMDAATFKWMVSGNIVRSDGAGAISVGTKSLSAELDRIRITTVNGSDTFDAGTINISYN